MHHAGAPDLARTRGAQVENEFGFVGPNEPYLRHIVQTARQGLGDEVVLYSTDPPSVINKGTLGGHYVYACAALPLPAMRMLHAAVLCTCMHADQSHCVACTPALLLSHV